MKQRSEAAI